MQNKLYQYCIFIIGMLYGKIVYAADTTGISGLDSMLQDGQSIIRVAAKWGGILTVVAAAIALGRGKLEGALAHNICKILIVIGLLTAAFTFFAPQMGWGFTFN